MFKKIYYINLDRRPDRDEHIKNELMKINIDKPVERIPAIDGRTLNIKDLPDNLITNEGKSDALNKNAGMYYILTPGAVGCALSHLQVYNKIIEELADDEYALIVEDDITIKDDFYKKLNSYINTIPKFDILFIGYHYYTNDDPTKKIYDDYGEPTKIFGLFGYIINVKAALTIKTVFPLRYQIDTAMPFIFDQLSVFYLKEKLIVSEESQEATKFGSDAQIREPVNVNEGFKNICHKKKRTNINTQRQRQRYLIILVLIIFLICYIYYLKYYKINRFIK